MTMSTPLINLANVPLTYRDLVQARRLHYEAALKTLNLLLDKVKSRYQAKAASLLKNWQAECTFNEEGVPFLGEVATGELTRISQIFSPRLLKQLVRDIAEVTGLRTALINRKMLVHMADWLNQAARWPEFTKTLTIGGAVYTSTFTPLNGVFDASLGNYGQNGYASLTTKLTEQEFPLTQRKQAINAWCTQFRRADGELLLVAFRSGAISERRIKDSAKRQMLAQAKIYHLLKAMVVAYLRQQSPTTRQAIIDGDYMPNIPVISISLLTSLGRLGWLPGLRLDKTILRDQADALAYFHQRVTEFELKSGRVRVTFTMIHFNKAVNEFRNWGANLLGQQKIINKVAFARLKKLVADRLPLLESPRQIAKVKQLWARIEEMRARRSWHSFSGSGTAYELPALVANLGFLLGAMVHYNCMSGKDRTGMADVEAKLLAYQMEARLKSESITLVPPYKAPFSEVEAEAMLKLILESGNLDIQQINTGVAGYKIRGAIKWRLKGILATGRGQQILRQYLAVDEQTSLETKQLINLVNGLSSFTEA